MNRKILSAAALAVAATSAPASAQSLALTYKLEPLAEAVQQQASAFSRCAGFNWIATIEACGREVLARVLPSRGEVASASAPALPALGSQASDARVISASSSARNPDVNLRFGSRFKGNEEGTWDWYRFKDANYESYVKNHGYKALGVELLVPFQ